MNINRLNELLTNPGLATREDYQNIKQLADNYPYAQFLKILLSKIAQIIKDENQVEMLHTAAIYSAERKVLKKLYTKDNYQYVFPPEKLMIHEQTEVFPEMAEDENLEPGEDPEINTGENATEQADEDENLAHDVLDNLKKFKDLREKYDHLIHEESDNVETDEKTSTKSPVVEATKENESTPEALSNDVDTKQDNARHIHQPDYQRRLIDDFMSNLDTQQERPLPPKEKKQPNEDLSGGSTSFDDDLVTETLAKLCIKQGKIDKAIEIYRKLIWKFPQKKTYFAARIEELTNN